MSIFPIEINKEKLRIEESGRSENETGAFKNYESREEWAYQKIGSLLLKVDRK